jgi:hypothetical protein
MVESIKGFFRDLGNAAVKVFDMTPLGKLVSLASGIFAGSESKTTIDVNLNDPGGAVKSVASRSAGSGVDLAVGLNMGG